MKSKPTAPWTCRSMKPGTASNPFPSILRSATGGDDEAERHLHGLLAEGAHGELAEIRAQLADELPVLRAQLHQAVEERQRAVHESAGVRLLLRQQRLLEKVLGALAVEHHQ